MGYDTSLRGHFDVAPVLTLEHYRTLQRINEQEHRGPNVPGQYCPWTPNDGGTRLQWDECDGAGNYVKWVKHLVTMYFVPWGYTLNGQVTWDGEEQGDTGRIIIENNSVRLQVPSVTWVDVPAEEECKY